MIMPKCPMCKTPMVECKEPVYRIIDITKDHTGQKHYVCTRKGRLGKNCGGETFVTAHNTTKRKTK